MAIKVMDFSANASVEEEHPEYKILYPDYEMLSDIKEGDRKIKEKGIFYLPKLTGMNPTEYRAYKDRAYFYGATARTITGLTGAIMRKNVMVEVPKKIEEILDPVSIDGLSLEEVIQSTTDSLLSYGRHGILTDLTEMDGIQRVYITEYPAASILNWRVELINGIHKLTYLALAEIEYKDDPNNAYSTIECQQIRILYIDVEGFVVVKLFERQVDQSVGKGKSVDTWAQIDVLGEGVEHQPKKMGGNRLTEIPFVFFGSTKNGADPNKPPLLDLACLNMAHWKLNADYFHGLHFCALPTPYAFGLQRKDKFTVGPTVAIIDQNEGAKIGMLEFTGNGLSAVRDALNDMERKMAVLGARFLEESKRSREVAAAMEIRASADNATLTTIARNLDHGFEHVVYFMMDWMNITGDVKIRTNKSFVPSTMSAKEITALLQAVQQGKLSTTSFLHQLKSGEIIPEFLSVEDEKALIAKEYVEPKDKKEPVSEVLEEEEKEENVEEEEENLK